MANGHRSEAWAGARSRHIDCRLVVEGDLVLKTPAQFGAGESDDLTDMPLLVDGADDVTPLLTGATLAGALRAYLYATEVGYRAAAPAGGGHDTLTYALFGSFKGDDDGVQSPLIVDDAYGHDFQVELRDGVKIDPRSRTAFAGGLFDMALWSAGTTFPIRLELLIIHPKGTRDPETDAEQAKQAQDKARRALLTALEGLRNGAITLGGRKRRGFGRFKVENWRVKEFDLRRPDGLCDWLRNGGRSLKEQGVRPIASPDAHPAFKGLSPAADRREWLEMEATFAFDGPMLIRSAGRPEFERDGNGQVVGVKARPDMVHLRDAKGDALLPGTTVAGVLRAQAGRILKLVRPADADDFLDQLFGSDLHRAGRGDQSAVGSRLIVEEQVVQNPAAELIQNRVAIDRFTGGARDTALFNEQPLWTTKDTSVKVRLRLIQPAPPPPAPPLDTDATEADKRKADAEEAERQAEVAKGQREFEAQVGLLLLLLKDLWTGHIALGGESSVGRGRLKGKEATLTYHHLADGAPAADTWEIKQAGDILNVDAATRQRLEKFVDALHGRQAKDDGQ